MFNTKGTKIMQLHGATDLERRINEGCKRFEMEGGAGELQTTTIVLLSEAGQELQRLREVIRYIHTQTGRCLGETK